MEFLHYFQDQTVLARMSEGGANASKRLCAVPGIRVGSCVLQLTTAIGVRCQSEGGGQHQDQVQQKAPQQCFLDLGSFLTAFSPPPESNKVKTLSWSFGEGH